MDEGRKGRVGEWEGGPKDALEGYRRNGFGEVFEGHEESDVRDDVEIDMPECLDFFFHIHNNTTFDVLSRARPLQ